MDPEAAISRALESPSASLDAGGWPIDEHARQLAEHLRAWQRELDRREAQLQAMLAALDQERRANRLWLSTHQESLAEREAKVAEHEAQVAEREIACDDLVRRFRSGYRAA
jgi:Skp family chaperone for outer membrane proteins